MGAESASIFLALPDSSKPSGKCYKTYKTVKIEDSLYELRMWPAKDTDLASALV